MANGTSTFKSNSKSRFKGKDEVSGGEALAQLFDKTPPHAIEAEMSLLGAMILEWQVTGEILQIISGPTDFYQDKHGSIYQALIGLYDKNIPIDLVQLKQVLEDKGQLEDVGGVDYLVALAEGVASSTSAPYYANIVREKATLRRLIESAGEILHTAYNTAEGVDDQLDKAEQQIFKLAEARDSGTEASDLGSLLQETYEKLEQQEGRHVTGISTGYYDLDEMTSGLNPGDMIILAARPSMGKTAFAINIAEHIGADLKMGVGVFSLEMGKQQLAQRLLCSRSGVDSHRLRRNMLNQQDYQDLSMAVGELADAPIYIDDTPGLTLLALRAKARRMAARYAIKMIVIDYLQLMSAPGADSRQQEVSNISRGIKALARELSVPVICLSQLNRASENREGHVPRMSDLRESGSIEQDADVVMMLHREEYYHKDPAWAEANPDKVGVAEVILAKQRNGPTGMVTLQFDGSTTRFNNLAR